MYSNFALRAKRAARRGGVAERVVNNCNSNIGEFVCKLHEYLVSNFCEMTFKHKTFLFSLLFQLLGHSSRLTSIWLSRVVIWVLRSSIFWLNFSSYTCKNKANSFFFVPDQTVRNFTYCKRGFNAQLTSPNQSIF